MTEQEKINQNNLFKAVASLIGTGKSFGWKKTDSDGNEIPNDQRITYENLIVHNASKPSESDVNTKIQENKDAETATTNKKASGKAKLKELGLDDAEIKALIGA